MNPLYGVRFFVDNAFLALGSVFLVVTGGEALYADLGHFDRRPIALGWFSFVLPGPLLNYFGQGALIATPEAIDNPFCRLASGWAPAHRAGDRGHRDRVPGADLGRGEHPKIPHGGWFPLVVGAGVFAMLTTWFTGRRLVRQRARRGRTPLPAFVETVMRHPPQRVPAQIEL